MNKSFIKTTNMMMNDVEEILIDLAKGMEPPAQFVKQQEAFSTGVHNYKIIHRIDAVVTDDPFTFVSAKSDSLYSITVGRDKPIPLYTVVDNPLESADVYQQALTDYRELVNNAIHNTIEEES